MIPDPVDELRRIRPQQDLSWPAGAQGQRVLVRSRETYGGPASFEPPRRSRRFKLSAVLGGFTLVGAAVVGIAAFHPSSAPTAHPEEVGCYRTLSATPDAITIWNNPDRTAAAGIAICRSHWLSQFGVAAPVALVACLVPDSGAPAVVPGIDGLPAEDTCARIGAQAEEE